MSDYKSLARSSTAPTKSYMRVFTENNEEKLIVHIQESGTRQNLTKNNCDKEAH